MENKIIETIKVNNDYKCLVCCERQSTTKIRINRLVQDDTIVSFYVCDECLSRIQKEIEICE